MARTKKAISVSEKSKMDELRSRGFSWPDISAHFGRDRKRCEEAVADYRNPYVDLVSTGDIQQTARCRCCGNLVTRVCKSDSRKCVVCDMRQQSQSATKRNGSPERVRITTVIIEPPMVTIDQTKQRAPGASMHDFVMWFFMRTLLPQDKFKIAYRDDFTCRFCGSRPGNDKIEIEHLIPVSKYGSDNEENLVAACQKCNRNKSNTVAFPKSMCEGVDRIDAEWTVHRSFGKWQVKFHPEHGVVLEYTPYGYWIGADRSHEPDWESHIMSKGWPEPHNDWDFIEALAYFRRMTKST